MARFRDGLDVNEYHRAVELSKMRQYMRYDAAEYRKDWEQAVAVAMLLATGSSEKLELVLDNCMKRILAYQANNPYEVPWNV